MVHFLTFLSVIFVTLYHTIDIKAIVEVIVMVLYWCALLNIVFVIQYQVLKLRYKINMDGMFWEDEERDFSIFRKLLKKDK